MLKIIKSIGSFITIYFWGRWFDPNFFLKSWGVVHLSSACLYLLSGGNTNTVSPHCLVSLNIWPMSPKR